MWKTGTACKCDEKGQYRKKHHIDQSDMYKCEYVDILMAVFIGIFQSELEVGHETAPRPELSNDEPSEQEEIQDGICKTRTI